jgi:hypothetical protein
MKNNIWKLLAIVFFAISLIEFIWGYASIKNAETQNTIRIKELEMRIQQDSIRFMELRNETNSQPPTPKPKIETVQEKVKKSDQEWLNFVRQNNLQNQQPANDSSGIYKTSVGQYYYCPSKNTFISTNKDYCVECPIDCPE